MTTTRARLDSLTGLRWFAALVVFVWHIQSTFGDRRVLYHLVRPGPLGVSFFFVLSGFVLVWSHRDGDAPLAFWRRRFARVYPNHAVTLVAALLVIHFSDHQPVPGSTLAQIPLLQAWVPNRAVYFGGNSVAWSLSCEAFFYALFPLMLPLINRIGPRRAAVVAVTCMTAIDGFALATRPSAAASAVVHWDWLAYICPAGRLPEFVVGMAAARALQAGDSWTLGIRRSVVLLAACICVVMVAPTPYDVAALTVAPIMMLLVALAQRDMVGQQSWLTSRQLIRLGEWSFAFYLVHQLVLRVLVDSAAPAAAVIVGGLAAAVTGAGLLHVAVERPAERRLRHARPRAQVEALIDRRLDALPCPGGGDGVDDGDAARRWH